MSHVEMGSGVWPDLSSALPNSKNMADLSRRYSYHLEALAINVTIVVFCW